MQPTFVKIVNFTTISPSFSSINLTIDFITLSAALWLFHKDKNVISISHDKCLALPLWSVDIVYPYFALSPPR